MRLGGRLRDVLQGAKRQRIRTIRNLALPAAPALALPAPPALALPALPAPSPADHNEDEEPLAPPAHPAPAPTSPTASDDDSSSEDSSTSNTGDDEPASQSTPVDTDFPEILDEDTILKHPLYQDLSYAFDEAQNEIQESSRR